MYLIRWKFIFKNHIIHIVNLWEVGNASRFVRLLVFTVFRSSAFLQSPCIRLHETPCSNIYARNIHRKVSLQLLGFEVLTKLPQWINWHAANALLRNNEPTISTYCNLETFIQLSINFRERAVKTILLKLD